MDSDNIKWFIGTAIALISLFLAYLQYQRSTEADAKKRNAIQQVPSKKQANSLPQLPFVKRSAQIINQNVVDLQEQLIIINSMLYPVQRQRELEMVVHEAIQRGELQFALAVIDMMHYSQEAQRCKELVIHAKRTSA